jgi:hypothetical protein
MTTISKALGMALGLVAMCACRSPATSPDAGPPEGQGRAPDTAPDGAALEAARTASGDAEAGTEPATAAATATAPSDPIARLAAVLDEFCRRDLRDEDLVSILAPEAVLAGGRTLPPGTAFVIRTEAVVSLYTADPVLGVAWWPVPPAGGPVAELHLVPETVRPTYAAFRQALDLDEGTLGEQGHPLADLPHHHRFACGDRAADLLLYEVTWKGEAVGTLRELVISRPAAPTPNAEGPTPPLNAAPGPAAGLSEPAR